MRLYKNVILEGPPGTGKSFSVAEIAEEWPRDKLGVDAGGNVADGRGAWAITFHPSTGYEEFVEGIRYNPEGDPKGFELLPGVFREWVDTARKSPEKDFLVLIDEVNRANISKVLGDLLFGLESSKRLRHSEACTGADPEHAGCWLGGATTRLPYSGIVLGVPDNLYVLGTMNSSDRSIAPLDAALRRRFAFVRVEPLAREALRDSLGSSLPEVGKEVISRSVDALDHLNSALRASLGPDSTLGHSYLFSLGATPGSTHYWMEMRPSAAAGGTVGVAGASTQVQIPMKEWVERLLLGIGASKSANEIGSGSNALTITVEYDGKVYSGVKLDRPGNFRFSATGDGDARLPLGVMTEGILSWSVLGPLRLALEFEPFHAGSKEQQLAAVRAQSTWSASSKRDDTGRWAGTRITFEEARGEFDERTVWRYSILPQLVDTVTQAFVPELLIEGLRDAWVRENLPLDIQATVLDSFAAFERFLHEQLSLQIVKAGTGLTSGLAIERYTPIIPATGKVEDGSDSGAIGEPTSD